MLGQKKIQEWMDRHDLTQRQFAAQLGITQSGLSRVVTGENMPHWKLLRRLNEVTKGYIRPDDWLAA